MKKLGYRVLGTALWAAALASTQPLLAQRAAPQASPARDDHPVLVEQGLNQLSSPFTKPTVLKLNAITARSKATIDAYDAAVPGIRAAIANRKQTAAARAARQAAMKQIGALATQAALERTDMKRAERRVRTSGEKYNDEILTAMVDFVVNVDTEIHREQARLTQKLVQR